MNQELPNVQAGFRKGRGIRDQIANIRWIIEKFRNSRKACISVSLITLKPLTVQILTNWKILRDGNIRLPYLPSETCMQVKKQQLRPNMEQWTGSKLGKEYLKAVYCHSAYLTYTQSTSCKMQGWTNHKVE